MMGTKTEGPRHSAWRQLRSQHTRIRREMYQFNLDLASVKENNPACSDLPVQPIVDSLPDSPPEPDFSE